MTVSSHTFAGPFVGPARDKQLAEILRLGTPDPMANTLTVAIVDERVMVGESLSRNLQSMGLSARHYPSVDAFVEAMSPPAAQVAVAALSFEWRPDQAATRMQQIAALTRQFPDIGFVILSSIEDPADIAGIIQQGARGYISPSDRTEVAVQVLHLVRAGGTYIPPSVLTLKSVRNAELAPPVREVADADFTPRQLAVAEGLRRGKANKLIAYELNMCESTVKVHIRSIMKKLKARNRTEAAYKMTTMMEHRSSGSVI